MRTNTRKKVTMKQVALRCGCSVATVSKALNGMPDIGAETAANIREVALSMGYTPSAAARQLKTNISRSVGLLFFLRGESIWTHDYFSRIAESIQDAMQEQDYDISPINCETARARGSYLDYCRHRGYDGVIVMSAGFDEPFLMDIIVSELPLVTIDYAMEQRSAVESDNWQGMELLVRHVHAMGHRRVAFVHGEITSVTQARLDGFRETCRDVGIAVLPGYVLEGEYRDPEVSAAATRALLGLPEPPTCILYPDDYSCVGGIEALRAAGLSVPGDMSVAGYDGIALSRLMRPRMTTIEQDARGIGQAAAELLLSAIHEGRNQVRHLMLGGRLIKGETVRAVTGGQ